MCIGKHSLTVTCLVQNSKMTEVPIQAWTRPEVTKSLRLPGFRDNQHIKVSSCRPYAPAAFPTPPPPPPHPPPEDITGTNLC
jgi:hypothetical protein